MASEIMDFPINSIVIFHSKLLVYQRVNFHHQPWGTFHEKLGIYQQELGFNQKRPNCSPVNIRGLRSKESHRDFTIPNGCHFEAGCNVGLPLPWDLNLGIPWCFSQLYSKKIPPHKSLQRSWNHKFCTIPNPLKLDRGDTDPSHKCKLFLSRAKIQTPQRGVHGSQVHQIVSSNPWMMGEFSVTNCVWFPGENSLRDFPSKINPLMVTHPVAGSCWKLLEEPSICSTGGSGQKAEGTTPSRSTLLEGVRGWSGYHWESLEKMQWGCACRFTEVWLLIYFYWSLFVDS